MISEVHGELQAQDSGADMQQKSRMVMMESPWCL